MRTCRAGVTALALGLSVAPALAQKLPSGWSIAPVESALGDTSSCAATKLTGPDKGIGFTRTSSGLELLTVAVKGWAYPLGESVDETVKIGDAAPVSMKVFGQNDATVAKGEFSTNAALRAASGLEVRVGDKHETFDIAGLDAAFDTLKACVEAKR